MKYPVGVTLWNHLSKFISCSSETVALQSTEGREGSAGTPHTQCQRNSIQLCHDPQCYFITTLVRTLPVLMESDNKVSVVVLFLSRRPMCNYTHTSIVYTN